MLVALYSIQVALAPVLYRFVCYTHFASSKYNLLCAVIIINYNIKLGAVRESNG